MHPPRSLLARRAFCLAGLSWLAGAGAHAHPEGLSLLRSGSHVLLMRHALAPGVGDPPGYDLARCETQRNLDAQGRQQAQRIGQWLRSQGLDHAHVYSSPWCRCRDTAAQLGLGPVTVEPALASFFDQPDQSAAQTRRLQAFVAQSLRQGKTPLVLVTHHVNIRDFMGQNIGSGDMVLARVNAQGQMRDYRIYPSP
jgi:phosphohistidine phosphatase SixA